MDFWAAVVRVVTPTIKEGGEALADGAKEIGEAIVDFGENVKETVVAPVVAIYSAIMGTVGVISVVRVAARSVTAAIRTLTGERELAVGIVACSQTHGSRATWHPHLQLLVTAHLAALGVPRPHGRLGPGGRSRLRHSARAVLRPQSRRLGATDLRPHREIGHLPVRQGRDRPVVSRDILFAKDRARAPRRRPARG